MGNSPFVFSGMDVSDANDISGDVQNFVGVHPSHPDDDEKLSKFSFDVRGSACSRNRLADIP
jgi:hypothetical protein